MWNLNEANDLEHYFKIIEDEAKDLRDRKPLANVPETSFSGGNNVGGGFGNNRGNESNWGYQQNHVFSYNPEKDPSTIFYSNYAKNRESQNGSSAHHQAGGDSFPPSNGGRNSYQLPPSSGGEDLYQVQSNYVSNHANSVVSNEQQHFEAQPVAALSEDPQYSAPVIPQDPDGYQRTDFNRVLIGYNESLLKIRHIFLTVFQKNDLMEYTTKILECTNQDKIMLSIQRDNQLAEAFAAQLRKNGYWSTDITNKTVEPEKLAEQHSVYRCIVTTMAFLRDNLGMFKRPTVIMNFDHVVNHVKFLERWLNYRFSEKPSEESNEAFIYEMCFQSSTTSQALKEYVQSKLPQV